ncbi:MAG: DUF3794 domain-containing protein [Clostridiaceae bacterium]|nr:DUF3794 domain-containing protein [Clostridiaceae bacterium]
MDNKVISNNCTPKKILQVPVIKGFGEKQELVVREIVISPPNPSVFRIINVDKVVTITSFKLIATDDNDDSQPFFRAKVIIDGFIDKNINYKTIADFTKDAVGGPVFQFTTRIDFATFVDVKAKEPIVETDQVEILNAFVEGEIEELLDPNPVPVGAPSFAVTFNKILEKMVVKIKLKVVRIEHVTLK